MKHPRSEKHERHESAQRNLPLLDRVVAIKKNPVGASDHPSAHGVAHHLEVRITVNVDETMTMMDILVRGTANIDRSVVPGD